MNGTVRRRGNRFVILVSMEEGKRAALRDGEEIAFRITSKPRQPIDLSHLRSFRLGGDWATRHDDVEWA